MPMSTSRGTPTCFGPCPPISTAKDVVIIEGLPGNALDPSASGIGTTSRMGLDATRGPDFHGVLARIDEAAFDRASAILAKLGRPWTE